MDRRTPPKKLLDRIVQGVDEFDPLGMRLFYIQSADLACSSLQATYQICRQSLRPCTRRQYGLSGAATHLQRLYLQFHSDTESSPTTPLPRAAFSFVSQPHASPTTLKAQHTRRDCLSTMLLYVSEMKRAYWSKTKIGMPVRQICGWLKAPK